MRNQNSAKKIAILGSTGSIGENSLEVIRTHHHHFRVCYLTVNRNTEKLIAQVTDYATNLKI